MTDTHISAGLKTARRALHGSLGLSLFSMIGLARQRRALRALDDHQLDDIGITKAEADAEARRPFWDAPVSWFK